MPTLDHWTTLFAAFEKSRAGESPEPIRRLRRAAMSHFEESGFPTTRLEDWKYTNVAEITKAAYELGRSQIESFHRADLERLASPTFACSLLVFVNGRVSPTFSSPPPLNAGLEVESLRKAWERHPELIETPTAPEGNLKQNAFAALNTAFLEDGASVIVHRDADMDTPIHLVFVSAAACTPTVSFPHTRIVMEDGSRATVIEHYVSAGDGPALTDTLTDIRLGSNAVLKHVRIEDESLEAAHFSNLFVSQGRDSRLSAHSITLGGNLVRNQVRVDLRDEGAECRLNGLFLGAETQHIDNSTLIDHAMPHCNSRELYKGILSDRAKAVFNGKIIVRPHAQKTNAWQSNPNLLLSDHAEINTKPQLEIYADDVKCSHGSTIGQIDEQTLFYLRARGIDEQFARGMLTQAFASEITGAIGVPALQDRLDERILERLARSRSGQETT